MLSHRVSIAPPPPSRADGARDGPRPGALSYQTEMSRHERLDAETIPPAEHHASARSRPARRVEHQTRTNDDDCGFDTGGAALDTLGWARVDRGLLPRQRARVRLGPQIVARPLLGLTYLGVDPAVLPPGRDHRAQCGLTTKLVVGTLKDSDVCDRFPL